MKTIPILKSINGELLVKEILERFPAWSQRNQSYGFDEPIFSIVHCDDTVELLLPETISDSDIVVVKTILDNHNSAAPSPSEEIRNQILAMAQSAVGVQLQNLTAGQIKALMAIILFKVGGVDPKTLQVLPLNKWV